MHLKIPLIAVALCTGAAPTGAEIAHRPGKLPVVIPMAEVTINGESRPDLGRAISDSIAGGLLKTGAFIVIDTPDAKTEGGGAASTGAVPGASPAHYAFIPRLIVEEDYYKLSVKKRRISDNELVQVYDTSEISPHRSTMFELLDDTMRLIYADVSRDRAKAAKAGPGPGPLAPGAGLELDPAPVERRPRPAPAPPAKTRPAPGPAVAAKTPPATQVPAIVRPLPTVLGGGRKNGAVPLVAARKPAPEIAKAKEATEVVEYAGRVRAVNADWDFCIIEVAKRGVLKVDEELLVRSEESLEPLGKLRITKVEGSQVVADSAGRLKIGLVRPGTKSTAGRRRSEPARRSPGCGQSILGEELSPRAGPSPGALIESALPRCGRSDVAGEGRAASRRVSRHRPVKEVL